MIDSHRDEIAKLESLYAMNPEGRVFTHLAEACRKAGQLDRARLILEEGLQKHPDYASAHVVLGRVLADSGEDDAAVGEFRRVLELDRHNLVAMRSLGEIAAREGRNDEAIHYYGELAILDPTDPEIQDTLRKLRDRPAAARTTPQEPDTRDDGPQGDETGAGAVEQDADFAAATGGDTGPEADTAETTGDDRGDGALDIESTESFGVQGSDVEPLEGLESTRIEPDPAGGLPAAGAGDLPEWPAVEPIGGIEQPGEDAPIDHAAWQEIAAGGTAGPVADEPSAEAEADEPPAEPAPAASAEDGEPQPFVAASGEVTEPLDEDHLRFVPPGMFGRPSPMAGEEAAEPPAGPGEDAPEAGPASGERGEPEADAVSPGPEEDVSAEVEGRWQTPESSHGDVQAERDRPADHSGEWIPEDRWEWVAASADSSGGAGSPEPEQDRDGESSHEPAAEASPGTWDEETSFAGLTDEPDVPAAYGIDEEVSFAGLADDDSADEAHEEEVSFAGIADSGPVDSFEEGAAAVLDAYARSEEEPEGDDAHPEPAPEPDFVTDPTAGEDDAPVSWVTESEDESDLVITETLAEIYASQGLYDRAAAVYRRLIEHHPDDDRLRARLADLESATGWAGETGQSGAAADDEREAFLERVESAWTGGEGAASMEDSPYAWAQPEQDEAETGPRAADYFAGLLAWRPTEVVPSTGHEPADPTASPLTEDWYAEEADREPPANAEEGEVGREGEEDLEMFRSWLKSLKK